MQALFFGAGASYDCGMPLVWELTAELRRWLTTEKLISFNQTWQQRGGGWCDTVIIKLTQLLENKELHYENIIGALEVEMKRERDQLVRQHFHAANGFLLQAIYGLLLERQQKNSTYAINALSDFASLKQLAEANKPLWIFSLNLDLIVEMLAAQLSIPIRSGFNEKVTFSMSADGTTRTTVNFERLSREDINNNRYNFFIHGEAGINLVKMHGSLDIFAHGDEISYLKACPETLEPKNFPALISQINTINRKLVIKQQVVCTNESIFLDESNNIQFLRNTLLSGAHKFSKNTPQLAPLEFLPIFQANINFASELICIGYSFGDKHIDDPLIEWLAFSKDRSLLIVNPGINGCPTKFNHMHDQVKCMGIGASEFFLGMSNKKESVLISFARKIRKARRDGIMKKLTNKLA
jgi:hypothetical protein